MEVYSVPLVSATLVMTDEYSPKGYVIQSNPVGCEARESVQVSSNVP